MAILAAVVDGTTQQNPVLRPGETAAADGHPRVLYVHASPDQRARMEQVFAESGFRYFDASPQDAVERADSVTPDVIVVDRAMLEDPTLADLGRLSHPRGGGRSLVVAHLPDSDSAQAPQGVDGVVRDLDPARLQMVVRELLDHQSRAYDARSSVDLLEREVAQVSSENDRLRSEARVRSDFMRNLAHELATPLTPLVGYLKLLRSGRLGPLNEKQQQVLEAMVHATERLEHSIDNLVDYSSLETGKYRIHATEFDASPMLEEVVRGYNAKARSKHVRLELRKPDSLVLTADERKLKQSIINVLDNALRFSPHGGHILVIVTDTPDDVTFSVFDQGPGLPVEIQRMSETVLPHFDERTGAAGLGLAVVRQVVAAHGGTLFLESPPREQPDVRDLFPGTRVAFRIPRRPPVSDAAS